MATYSSILAWRMPMDRRAWLQSMGSQRVGHDQATNRGTRDDKRRASPKEPPGLVLLEPAALAWGLRSRHAEPTTDILASAVSDVPPGPLQCHSWPNATVRPGQHHHGMKLEPSPFHSGCGNRGLALKEAGQAHAASVSMATRSSASTQ